MKIGWIGAGNMAGAIIRGTVSANALPPGEIGVTDIDTAKARALAEACGVVCFDTAVELIDQCDAVGLAVKPGVFPALLPELASRLTEKKPLVLSIAAGKTLAFIGGLIGDSVPLVRVMPNINAKVGAAMSAYCPSQGVSAEQEALVQTVFRAVGRVVRLDESYFPLFGVIAGSAPAFAYLFIDSLARAAVKNGMAKQTALEIAAQTVLGSAELILRGGEHPWALIDQVCSPGGTTIEGVAALQRDGLEAAVMNAVDAALEKDSKL